MRFPWHRQPTGPTEAERAHAEALNRLADTRAREAEVNSIGTAFREWRERNHVVEQIQRLIQGGHA